MSRVHAAHTVPGPSIVMATPLDARPVSDLPTPGQSRIPGLRPWLSSKTLTASQRLAAHHMAQPGRKDHKAQTTSSCFSNSSRYSIKVRRLENGLFSFDKRFSSAIVISTPNSDLILSSTSMMKVTKSSDSSLAGAEGNNWACKIRISGARAHRITRRGFATRVALSET